jgi:ribosomal protein S18 acetylase RimI-like enzyme
MLTVIALTSNHFDRWSEHLYRHLAESGKDGLPLFSPIEDVSLASSPERRTRFEMSVDIPVLQPGWMRVWAVEAVGGSLIAHVDLTGSTIPSEKHRATVGIGCERNFHRQGLGRTLMKRAIEFAVENRIEWIDLFVFGENTVALALYKSFGFAEIGRRADRFRIAGRSVDDVMMTLHVPLAAQ